MRVEQARAAAAAWVAEHGRHLPGFRGAYLSGSTSWLPAQAELPPGSDVDIMVVTPPGATPPKLGKFGYRGLIVEVSYLSQDLVAHADHVLGSYHLAGGLRTDTILADPTGALRPVQAEVSRRFAEPDWVRRRCRDARRRIETFLASVDGGAPFANQVTAWLFATGVTTHVLLVAGLRNPTIRRRYLAVREMLAAAGRSELYPPLLRLLGVEDLTPEQVIRQLRALGPAFDEAAALGRTPFPFSTDITPVARPIAIDASQRMIDEGRHREAVFWIVATFARCQQILAADAPDRRRAFDPAFAAAVADLGITCTADLHRRGAQVTAHLPALDRAAEEIITSRGGTAG